MRRSLTELFFPRGVFPNSVEDGWGYEGSSNTRAAFFSLPWMIKAVGNEFDAEKVTLVPMQASGALQNYAGLQNMSDGLTAIWREVAKTGREESPQKIELILLHPVFYIGLLKLFRSLCQFFFWFPSFLSFPNQQQPFFLHQVAPYFKPLQDGPPSAAQPQLCQSWASRKKVTIELTR